MRRVVTAIEVIEENDISGQKYIQVVGRESDELVAVNYHLTSRYMIPYEKLMLTTVSPEDQIMVEINEFLNPTDLVIGEYIGNMFDAQDRLPLCRCGTLITTDGNDIFCPNRKCGLTILSRLKRLASCRFFSAEKWNFSMGGLVHDSSEFVEKPFSIILDSKLWSWTNWPIERVLFDPNGPHISMATFLVMSQFQSFIDATGSSIDPFDPAYKSLSKFYEVMDRVVFGRDYESDIQNNFIKQLLWSFSIPGLSEDIINKMVIAETSFGLIDEVLLPYANYLTNSRALQDDLGVERITADWICREVFMRRHEFFDIFTAYSLSSDIVEIFNNLNNSFRNTSEIFRLHTPKTE